jgi:hypothetical protein
MARRRTNGRPSRNQLRDLHRVRDEIAYGPRVSAPRVGLVDDVDDVDDAAAEIAAYRASLGD